MPKKICNFSGCHNLISYSEKYCDEHKKVVEEKVKEKVKQRSSSSSRGYNSTWRRYRIHYLKQNPLCIECMEEGKYTPATIVDHIIPHKGNMALFWDTKNHQSLCKQHHDIKTASEDGGFGNERKNSI